MVCLPLTWAVHLGALVGPLRTLAVVAVSQAVITGQAVYSKHVLGTDMALTVAVLGQITLVMLPSTLVRPGQDLCMRLFINVTPK